MLYYIVIRVYLGVWRILCPRLRELLRHLSTQIQSLIPSFIKLRFPENVARCLHVMSTAPPVSVGYYFLFRNVITFLLACW